jgi:hypothetical protein
MVDISILDEHSTDSESFFSSQSTDTSTRSMDSTSSHAIKFLFKELFKNFPDDGSSDGSSDGTFTQSSQDSQNLLEFSQGSLQFSKGGTLPIKYHIKKSVTTRKNKNKNKPRTKSKTPVRRITIRIKRMMKSKFTKPKTYKRRATGGKRKSKPNKTMRRYRRVRK